MSETCIVCLGDLSIAGDDAAPRSSKSAKLPIVEVADATGLESTTTTTTELPEIIAHIQPCGHDLHNACLRPWVERANSCPICRATFNVVELKHHVGGHVVSSYMVEDRTQVAELDPAMFLEIPDEDDEDEPCQACGECDNDDVLMYCDGCNKLWHTYCVDLQEVPRGAWYCSNCRALRGTRPQGRPGGASRRRTRGQQRRQRSNQMSHEPSDWNDVWQSIFSHLGMDVDFPHDEDGASANAMRRHRQRVQASRQARHAWQSRLRVAELAGAGQSFREREAAILHGGNRRARPSPPRHVETIEETDAWNAFEEARAPSAEPSTSRKRKRNLRSRSNSPVEPQESTPIQVKRRRISIAPEPEDGSHPGEVPGPDPVRVSPVRRVIPGDGAGPSFLQSLLQEVEDSSNAGTHFQNHRPLPRGAGSPVGDQSSPHPSSPAISPSPSNHSSPRATSATPPPPAHIRPSSPVGLSSRIQPVFPSAEYSPIRISPEPGDKGPESPTLRIVNPIAQPRPQRRSRIPPQATAATEPRSPTALSTRKPMSLMAKSDVQKLVSAALKPHYNEQKITKDEYTTINRTVSRLLYEKIGNLDSLDLTVKAKWEKVAGDEVDKAVGALRAQA